MTDIIYTDRTRIEDHEKCARKRYWRYEYQGRGIDRSGDLKLDARIGTGVHEGIESGLTWPENISKTADMAGERTGPFLMAPDTSAQVKADIIEAGYIVTALTYAWLRVIAPRLLAEGDILAIEKEMSCDFAVPTPAGSTTVRLMTRPDIIWRRRSDGTIFIRNLKTVRKADDRWREKWALDQQTLSEPLAVDEWLKPEYVDGSGECKSCKGAWIGSPSCPACGPLVCGGVIIDGLVTGEVLFDKYRGLFYHNNPLIYAWASEEDIAGKRTFYPRYEWSCTELHKMANGHRCEGGKSHKLSGVRKVSVADVYPGGIIAWVDYLISNHPDVVQECIIELPPIIRSEYQIERWKRQSLAREIEIKRHAARADNMEGEHRDAALDIHFPMSTSNGNCIFPSKCAFYDCCHGSAGSDPLNAGYQFRIPNHPQENINE